MSDDNTFGRVIDELRAAAEAGAPGSRLPSVRQLVARHGVSPVTVQRAVTRLAAEGLVEPVPGRGTFVAAGRTMTLGGDAPPDLSWQPVALGSRSGGESAMQQLLRVAPAGAISLSGGYVGPELQPVRALGNALARAARRTTAWERGPVEGRADLRAWFAREAGGGFDAHDVVICSGGQAALSTTMRALTDAGDPVLVESPTYLGAIAAARAAGLRIHAVPADERGIRPDLLADALERTGARAVYLQPIHANPTGATLATERRAAVLSAVRDAGAFLVEDDWARDLTFDGPAPAPLAAEDRDGHVIHIRSLTKSAAPGLRVAGVAARGAAGARLRSARIVDDFFVAGPLQEATLDLVSSPAWPRHLRTLQGALRERRDVLVTALSRYAPALKLAGIPDGGLHLWAALPGDVDDVALTEAAAQGGVIVFPGRPWFSADPPAPHLRLTFAAEAPRALVEGARRLGVALRAARR